jgi:hypothetical protein
MAPSGDTTSAAAAAAAAAVVAAGETRATSSGTVKFSVDARRAVVEGAGGMHASIVVAALDPVFAEAVMAVHITHPLLVSAAPTDPGVDGKDGHARYAIGLAAMGLLPSALPPRFRHSYVFGEGPLRLRMNAQSSDDDTHNSADAAAPSDEALLLPQRSPYSYLRTYPVPPDRRFEY